MVIKLGVDESILWDQFIYSGAPEEFAWILPVPSPETVVELADSAFINVVDEETSPLVLSPPCAGAAGGCGCGGINFVNLADQVVVHQHATVGPYETVVIGAEDPNAVYAWLGQNGYAFPDFGLPILDYYVQKQSSFVILRLRPGVEVSAMQPVRVRFKGFLGQFPLKMVTLGALGAVDLSLWVIADERYAPSNFENARIDPTQVVWDWASNSSNYAEVFDQAVLAGGAAWITEYSQVLSETPLADRLQSEAPVDFALATAGIHYPVLTRLRTRLPVEALGEDLALAPSEEPGAVDRELTAGASLGECAGPVAAGLAPRFGEREAQFVFWIMAALAAIWLRRRWARDRG